MYHRPDQLSRHSRRCFRYRSALKCAASASGEMFRLHNGWSDSSPSLLLTLAKTGPWLLVSWEELLNDDGGRLFTSGLSHTSVDQSQSRKGRFRMTDHFTDGTDKYCGLSR